LELLYSYKLLLFLARPSHHKRQEVAAFFPDHAYARH
jgi:hypothetical protein